MEAETDINRLTSYIRQHKFFSLMMLVPFALGVVIFFWALSPNQSPSWTGFGPANLEQDVVPAKTLWNWLGLLLINAVLLAFSGIVIYVLLMWSVKPSNEDEARELKHHVARGVPFGAVDPLQQRHGYHRVGRHQRHRPQRGGHEHRVSNPDVPLEDVQCAGNAPENQEGQGESQKHPHTRQPRPGPRHHSDHGRPIGPQGHTDPDLATPAFHAQAHDAEDSGAGERQAQQGHRGGFGDVVGRAGDDLAVDGQGIQAGARGDRGRHAEGQLRVHEGHERMQRPEGVPQRHVGVVGEPVRDPEVQERPRRPGRLALLLEDRDDLGAGHREGQQRVAERLERERLAVGDDTVALTGRRP